MLDEVLRFLDPKPGENFIDCTLGGGGYTLEIAKRILPNGKILAIDLDDLALENFESKILNLKLDNVVLAKNNFKDLKEIANNNFTLKNIKGIVFDLGLSSAQLEDRSRGFSFNSKDSLLSMNFSQSGELTAGRIINEWQADDLIKIFKEYGEEKFSKKIAESIVKERKINRIETTGLLVNIILKAIPKKFQSFKIHPATRVFQSLRIAVNDELANISSALPQAVNLLASGGRLAIVSYHSLEDRIVKKYFKQEATDCLCPPSYPVCQCGHTARLKIIKPALLRPTEAEIKNNPRARSAKLRVAEKL